MSSVDEIIHFFEVEIEISQDRMQQTTKMFNGVSVGFREARRLNEAHIRYCKHIIEKIRSNSL